jgi:predicted molibdopterin-dependent oxidoreductase YjgC
MQTTRVQITVKIDGNDYVCTPDEKILDVAKRCGIDIPTLCYNPLFASDQRVGVCRMCVVEVISGGKSGLQSSCTLPVSTGLVISTRSKAVYNERRMILELLLSEHLFDCWHCDISGNCNFAKLCRDYDLDGVPVCAECFNKNESCLLQKGILCLGPITQMGCRAYCTNRCEACYGCYHMITNESILKSNIDVYKDRKFSVKNIIEVAQIFSFDSISLLKKVLKEEGFNE